MQPRKYKVTRVTPQDKIRMDMERSPEARIVHLLALIRLSNLVSEAGYQYRKSK